MDTVLSEYKPVGFNFVFKLAETKCTISTIQGSQPSRAHIEILLASETLSDVFISTPAYVLEDTAFVLAKKTSLVLTMSDTTEAKCKALLKCAIDWKSVAEFIVGGSNSMLTLKSSVAQVLDAAQTELSDELRQLYNDSDYTPKQFIVDLVYFSIDQDMLEKVCKDCADAVVNGKTHLNQTPFVIYCDDTIKTTAAVLRKCIVPFLERNKLLANSIYFGCFNGISKTIPADVPNFIMNACIIYIASNRSLLGNIEGPFHRVWKQITLLSTFTRLVQTSRREVQQFLQEHSNANK